MSISVVSDLTAVYPPLSPVKTTVDTTAKSIDDNDKDIGCCELAQEERILRAPRGDLIMPRYIMKADVVNPDMINPYDCTYDEFIGLLSTLSEFHRYSEVDFSLPGCFGQFVGNAEKMDYHHLLADYATQQSYAGNMSETLRIGGIASALADAHREATGTVQYMNGQRVYHMIPGAIGYIPSFPPLNIRENGVDHTFYLVFAKDSTKDNPVLEVQRWGDNGDVIEKKRVNINGVNPMSASLYELYALSYYSDLQKINEGLVDWSNPKDVNPHNATFHRGNVNKLFLMMSVNDFFNLQRDWINLLNKMISGANVKQMYDFEMIQELFDDQMKRIHVNEKEKETMVEHLFLDAE